MEENIVCELCPQCENEVISPADNQIIRCPHCGNWIVLCSQCLKYREEVGDYCNTCPYEKIVEFLNTHKL